MKKILKFLPATLVFTLLVAVLFLIAKGSLKKETMTNTDLINKNIVTKKNEPFFYKVVGELTIKDKKPLATVGQKFTLLIATAQTPAQATGIIEQLNVPYECFYIPKEVSPEGKQELQVQCGIFAKRAEALQNLDDLKKQNLTLLSQASIKLLD